MEFIVFNHSSKILHLSLMSVVFSVKINCHMYDIWKSGIRKMMVLNSSSATYQMCDSG